MYLRPPAITVILLLVGLLLSSLPAPADVLVLKDGDGITGEIKRIWDNGILIEPEFAYLVKRQAWTI